MSKKIFLYELNIKIKEYIYIYNKNIVFKQF